MLELYKDKQSLFYEEVMNIVKNKKINHAYLIETNGYNDKDNLILSFIKMLFSYTSYNSEEEFLNSNVSNLIDQNIFSDLMIIEPDGSFIKKDQISEIKENFKTTSISNNIRIYWIKEADKLNKQSSNALLKFLEEPDGNIIAIFDVDNRYKLLETIRSRCQIFSLKNVNNRKKIEDFDLKCQIIKCLEDKKEKAIAYLPVVLENDYRDKNFWRIIFLDMIEIYENALRKKMNLDFHDYGEILDYLLYRNEQSIFFKRIVVLFDTISSLNYNLNIQMMLDEFIIKCFGGE